MKFGSLFAAAVLSMPMLSQASVVYEWTGTNNEAPRGIGLRLEFDDKTYQSGGFTYNIRNDPDQHDGPRPGLGLISLALTLPGEAGGMLFTREGGFGTDPWWNTGVLNLRVNFSGPGLTGYIEAGNFETGFTMANIGGDDVFTVLDLDSDADLEYLGCNQMTNTPCGGATGVIRRVEVPEPGTLALIGAGLFAAGRFRRKVRR